jgi:hypothetical protein
VAGKDKQLASADLTAVRVLEEYRRLAFIDLRSFFDEKGELKPPKEWSAEQGAALSSRAKRLPGTTCSTTPAASPAWR